jgi:hypothetical protein
MERRMAKRSLHPEFTWWPYRTLAILIPLIAAGAASMAAELEHNFTSEEYTLRIITVFYAILGAGNAYLFAMAIGDFGKSVFAIPVGAFAGMLAVQILSYGFGAGIYIAFLLLTVIRSLTVGTTRPVVGCFLIGALVLGGFGISFNLANHSPFFSALLGYPFVCGAVAACMPCDWTRAGVYSALLAGTLNAVQGMAMALGLYLLVSFTLGIAVALIQSGFVLAAFSILMGGLGFGSINYFCVQSLFHSVYRSRREDLVVVQENRMSPKQKSPAAPAQTADAQHAPATKQPAAALPDETISSAQQMPDRATASESKADAVSVIPQTGDPPAPAVSAAPAEPSALPELAEGGDSALGATPPAV